jgi:uncharacterized protein YjbI with pentapeptide repeats/energy-coupling factor transporter ATP-binding protein EcfA2
MIQPQRACVKPRVLSPGGEALPLEDEVRSLMDAGARGLIQITGPSGSGKTTALQHLAAVLPSECCALYMDEGGIGTLGNPAGNLVLVARREAIGPPYLAAYQMAPWGEDEWIEYLLAVHRERCASVVKRLRAAVDRDLLPSLPELWRIVLDEMAVDESVNGVRQALRRFVAHQGAGPNVPHSIRMGCLKLLLPGGAIPFHAWKAFPRSKYPLPLWRLLRHEPVQLLLAAEQILADLRDHKNCLYLEHRVPRPLVRETAAVAAAAPEVLEYLHKLAAGRDPSPQPMAASILHATDTGWVPAGERVNLARAYLQQAAWPYVRLAEARLEYADLSGAYLHEAVLDLAYAEGANLSQARLPGASLRGFFAVGANLAGADLSLVKADKAVFNAAVLKGANLESAVLAGASFMGTCLEGACLVEADLSGAILKGADITDADFTAANLEEATLAKLCLRKGTFTGARFARAILNGCDLEYLQLPAADFRDAKLTEACLTGSWMPDANFENARLRHAGLADINWAGACLRGADLTGASFHAGSSRSGLIFSPIACEGSRTGFYTDDSEEQYFKCPEEIRKANLCGADLRGAVLRDVDFYLVDLRGALFDPEQEQHFRRCRAILEVRV